MKKFLNTLTWLLFLAGAVFLLLPYHMQFTGYVLILLGCGILLCRWLLKLGFKWLFGMFAALMILCTLWLTGSMGIIGLYGSFDAARPDSEYAVILGAEVNGTTPSKILAERLERGLRFMEDYPDTVIILSGGQGEGEDLPESQVMYDYLAARGADMTRVYQENRSRNTRQNLKFSGELAEKLGLDRKKVTIITSEFHIARAEYIASTLNMDAHSVAAKTEAVFFRLNYYLRESFSFVKAFVQGVLNT